MEPLTNFINNSFLKCFVEDKIYSRINKENIEHLIERFGDERKSEIQKIYQECLREIESYATFNDYIPIISYRKASDILSNFYVSNPFNK